MNIFVAVILVCGSSMAVDQKGREPLPDQAGESQEEVSLDVTIIVPLTFKIGESLEAAALRFCEKHDLDVNRFQQILVDKITKRASVWEEREYENIFTDIYKHKIWNNGDASIPLSGPGSSLQNTANVRKSLDSFYDQHEVKSVLDLGCGDLTWIVNTKMFNEVDYTGIDIVDSLIEAHKKKYPNHSFGKADITRQTFDYRDLVIVRDVIFHLSIKDVQSLFRNLKGRFGYICITTFRNTVNNDNMDRWHYSPRNIGIKPFNVIGTPVVSVYEPTFNRDFCVYSHDEFYRVYQ